MKICFVTDLHLPDTENAIQYKVLDWAISDIAKKNVDLVVFAGDYTANGLVSSIRRFRDAIGNLPVPVVMIPGNSDFRTSETKKLVREMASGPVFEKDGVKLIGLMDGEGTVSDEIWALLDHADENTVVCGHHPPESLRGPHGERLLNWLKEHPGVTYFCGHLHYSGWVNESIYLLPAADPDKSIGENPAITYYDTETKQLRKSYFYCPVPYDFADYIGISCRNPEEDIPYAIEHGIQHLEVRGNFAYLMSEPVKDLLQQWRNSGGVTLSVHAPDIFTADWSTYNDADWVPFTEAVNVLSADRITLHVPNISVGRTSEAYLHEIAAHVAEYLTRMPEKLAVGIENMHMTPTEKPDTQRRFGYLPEEVLQFVSILSGHTAHPVGSHLDVGHARNNAPYSQKYPIGSWYRIVGPQANGYHIHQVILTEHGMENHMPIDNWYGSLISYASFFREWNDCVLAKAPVFLEIRPKNGHMVTIEMLEQEKKRCVFDLHSHTRYSDCGRDEPQDVVNTVVANGVKLLGITDHNYGIGTRKAEYLREMRQLAEDNKDRIRILCGIEIATMPRLYDIQDVAEIKDCAYCLLEHIDSPESLAYGRLFEFAKQLGIPCGIAHTDLFAYCDQMGFEYETFFKQLAEAGIFWEMNVSYDSIHRYREHPYVIDFMNDARKQEIIKNAGVYISVGFDGHRHEDYDGLKVSQMVDFLHAAGIRTADELLA